MDSQQHPSEGSAKCVAPARPLPNNQRMTRLLLGWVIGLSLGIYLLIAGHDWLRAEGTQRFDEWVLHSLRRPEDQSVPIGPDWLHEAALDATALGSYLVLSLLVSGTAFFLMLTRRYVQSLFTVAAVAGAYGFMFWIKHFVDRERPAVVPHLRDVTLQSFPSGHAMMSAAIYLTLAALASQGVTSPGIRAFWFLCAGALAALTGTSRVFLGVHYPTDVLAGWVIGALWAMMCVTAWNCLSARTNIDRHEIGFPEKRQRPAP